MVILVLILLGKVIPLTVSFLPVVGWALTNKRDKARRWGLVREVLVPGPIPADARVS